MSSPATKRFVVYAPDYADALPRRLNARERHAANIKVMHGKGIVESGGAMMSPDGPCGSMVIMRGTSIEEIKKVVESDVYWNENVWDKERLAITPFALVPLPPLPPLEG